MARQVEIFSAGCGVCKDFLSRVKAIACNSCNVTVLDTQQPDIAERAKGLGIRSLPALVVNGKLVSPDAQEWYSDTVIRESGIGSPA
jgi:glutaredoxin 3